MLSGEGEGVSREQAGEGPFAARLAQLEHWLQAVFGLSPSVGRSSQRRLLLLENFVNRRSRELGLPPSTYLTELQGNEQEGLLLVNELTNAVTYFQRQPQQLEVLSKRVLPELCAARAGTRRLSVWSAGCATGEEAYTLGATLLDSGLFEGWYLQVIGTDVSAQRIEAARAGVYSEASFRAAEPSFCARHFQRVASGFEVLPHLRAVCKFQRLNLLDAAETFVVGRVDLAVCRNVLVYLGIPARQQVEQVLYERLLPDGLLLLGPGERLSGTRFAAKYKSLDVYQRGAGSLA